MPDHPNQPQEFDAVLGGQTPIPEGSAILGGIEGVKRRLASAVEEQRIAALWEALNYGEAGLDLVIGALQDESGQVEKTAYLLLRERIEAKVKQALKECNPWRFVTCLRTLGGHSCYVNSVAISPNGQTLVSASQGGYAKVWHLSTGKLIRIIGSHSCAVGSVAISPDGQTLVSGSGDATIKIWHLLTGELLRTLQGHSDRVTSVAISPDGQTIVSGSRDATIKIWHLLTGELLRTLQGHSDRVTSVAISPDGRTIVSGSGDTWSGNGDTWSGSGDATIKIWHLPTGELLRTLQGHSGEVFSVAISPDGQTLVSGGYQAIKIWHLPTGELLRTLEGNSCCIWSVVISPNGQTIVSGGLDTRSEDWSGDDNSTIQIWHFPTGELLRTLQGHSGEVFSVAISPDGQTIVSGSYDKTIKIWGVP